MFTFGCSLQTGRDLNALKIFMEASSFLVATSNVDVDLRMAKAAERTGAVNKADIEINLPLLTIPFFLL